MPSRYILLFALLALLAVEPTTAFWSRSKPKEAELVVNKEEPVANREEPVEKANKEEPVEEANKEEPVEEANKEEPVAAVTEPVVEEERTLEADIPVEYGVDISYPMHQAGVSTNYPWLPHNVDPSIPVPPEYEGMPIQPLGNRQAVFDEYMAGCVERYGDVCFRNERDRIEMNVRQIHSMINYTETGFLKIKAPERVYKLLREFWDANKDKARLEDWPAGVRVTLMSFKLVHV